MSDQPGLVIAERLEATVDELATELAALPEESFTRRAAPDEWTAAEVVGHIAEIMPYWAHVAAAVSKEPGRAIGRGLDDPERLGAVAAANDVPRGEALAHMRAAAHESATLIKAHDRASWSAEGVHPAFGQMPVSRLIESLLVAHVDAHVTQALAAAGE